MGGGGLIHGEPDWVADADEQLALTYRRHANMIRAGHSTASDLVHVYNFGSEDDGFTPAQFDQQLEYMYRREGKSFKLNMSMGFILQNRDTLEFRYFHAHANSNLFDRPVFVKNVHDLDRLMERVRDLDIIAQLSVQRPDTKYRLVVVTNVKYTVYVTSFALGCPELILPPHIMNNRFVKTLLTDHGGGSRARFNDSKCFFRCLATFREMGDVEGSTDEFMQAWVTQQGHEQGHEFAGVYLEEMEDLEEFFQLNLNVLSLAENSEAVTQFASTRHFPETMNLDLFGSHVSLITELSGYAKKYLCSKCEEPYQRFTNCKRHETTCKGEHGTRYKYPGGFYKHTPTVFEKMAECGVEIPEAPFYDYFITYDYESLLVKPDVAGDPAANTQWLAEHRAVAVSVCSNVPGYEHPKCMIDGDLKELVSQKLDYMREIRAVAVEEIKNQFADTIQRLGEVKAEFERLESIGIGVGAEIVKEIKTVEKRFEKWLTTVPALSFNGSGYDLQLVMKVMVEQLDLHDCEGFVIKKGRRYTCVDTDEFRFLDISQYLAANTNYAQFLKAYQCSDAKSYFPYEWFDNLDKLQHPSLPPYEEFYSALKQGNTLNAEREIYERLAFGNSPEKACRAMDLAEPPLTGQQNYAKLQDVWQTRDMTSFSDFLEYYANLDTKPFVEAVVKMREPYRARGVDPFKDAQSCPGISRHLIFRRGREQDGVFAVLSDHDKDLHKTFRQNVCGGPSIIFTRSMESGKTLLRDGPEVCQSVQGFDASNLYGAVLNHDIPTGPYIRRYEEKDYIPEKRDRYMMAFHWLDYKAQTEGVDIAHWLNSGAEVRIGGMLLDGFCRATNVCYMSVACSPAYYRFLYRPRTEKRSREKTRRHARKNRQSPGTWLRS